jgi:hypothetical protein
MFGPSFFEQTPTLHLMQFDGQRVAIELDASGSLVRGVARFEQDDLIGGVLRIRLEESGPGNAQIIIGSSWRGTLVADFHCGCDIRLVLH